MVGGGAGVKQSEAPRSKTSSRGGSWIDQKLQGDRRLTPLLFFRNNILDIIKLAAQSDPKLSQACRNLVYLSFNRWASAIIKNLQEEER